MGSKVYDVYNTVNTKPNIFYSAYLKNKVQFNDVDPDKIIVLQNEVQPELSETNEQIEKPEKTEEKKADESAQV
tara:strand:- start:685 stop:906 length:222 start_codon:yes stop_codon:yes gene_type:complete